MTELLSSDEVAEVAPGTADGAPPPTGRTARRSGLRVRSVDFSRPTKFTQEQQRRIERSHESFCRSAGVRLSGELHAEFELEVVDLTQVTLAGATAEVPAGAIWAILRTDGLGTSLLLALELPTVMSLIERWLGGVPGPPVTEHELTEIERSLARRVFMTLVEELSVVWEDLLGVTLSLDTVETQGLAVQIAPPTEPTIAITIELRDGVRTSSVSLIVPYRSIEAVVDRLPSGQVDSTGDVVADDHSRAALRATVAEAEIELRVEVAALEVPLDEVLRLRVGDVVSLRAPMEAGATVFASGTSLHRVRPGRRGRRRAVEIIERLGSGG